MIHFLRGTSLFIPCALLVSAFSTLQAQSTAATTSPAAAQAAPDRAGAYYHYGLAKIYEDQAVSKGRQDLATQAIEQYKLALNADPDSQVLQDGIANLYFRLGRIREAVSAAQEQVNK